MVPDMTHWQPENRTTVMPYLVVEGGDHVLSFLAEVFGAEILNEPLRRSDGSLWNAEVRLGDSVLMVSEARGFGPYPGFLYVYVPDCDVVYRKALAHGATSIVTPTTEFYGDRNAGVQDKAGNFWWIATHVEDVDPEELERRAARAAADRQD